jgi:threonine/homoserine/homoserine lactone efflux protein
MDLGSIFITAFIVGWSGAMTPGPLLTATIAETARRGFWAGPFIVLGHAVLELILVLALNAGFSDYLTRSGVTRSIALLGGLFLIYMGMMMIKDVWLNRISISQLTDPSTTGVNNIHPIVSGILISLFNPFWLVWWATVGLSYITLALKNGSAGLVAFYSGHILSDFVWYSLIALTVSRGRRFLTPRLYNAVLALCGLFLVGLGVSFIYSGLVT